MTSLIEPSGHSAALFAAAMMRRILTEPPPDENGVARIRQIGLMMLIYNIQSRGMDPTTNKIEEVSGLDRRKIYEIVKELEAKKLLATVAITNRHNKGRVFKYVIPDAVLDPLSIEDFNATPSTKKR